MALKDYDFTLKSSQVALGFIISLIICFFIAAYAIIDHFIPKKQYPHKYCYFVNKNGGINKAYAADYKSEMRNVDKIFHKDNFSWDLETIHKLGACQKVYVIKYLETDSSYVKIRFNKWALFRGGGDKIIQSTGYVPKYLLHDTLCKDCKTDTLSNDYDNSTLF